MWFKNAVVYSIDDLSVTATELDDRLSMRLFTECLPTQEKSAGWVSPFGNESKVMAHSVSGRILITMKTEEKNIPASVINEECSKRVTEWRARNDGKRMPKDLKDDLKERIKHELLPRAFSKYSNINAYIDTLKKILVIDTGSRKKCEGLILLLKSSLESEGFNAKPFCTKENPANVMSNWVLGEGVPDAVEVGEKCTIREEDGKGTIKYNKQDLDDSNLYDYLNHDKCVSELDMFWEDKLSCIVNEDLQIKSIKYQDISEAETDSSDDEFAKLDTEFYLMSSYLSEFYLYMIECFGGMGDQEANILNND